MFFTREDINKIYQALLKLGIKDSELPETSDVKNDDTLAIVQDGKNKQINVREFLNQISLWKREDFINVTDKYKKSHITLVEAIQAIPIVQRKEGLVITFLDTENNWRIYQFRGSLLQFNNETLWVDLYDFSPYIIDPILPDEEDITQSAIDEQGNTYLSLKDRKYNPSEFSGKGYKILRKNIIEIEDENSNKVKKNILTQDMINEPNTIYEIRYDFDLNGAKIKIKEGCTLLFTGGRIFSSVGDNSSCNIKYQNTLLIGDVNLKVAAEKSSKLANKEYCIDWFGLNEKTADDVNSVYDWSVAFTHLLKYGGTLYFTPNKKYYLHVRSISDQQITDSDNVYCRIQGNGATIHFDNKTPNNYIWLSGTKNNNGKECASIEISGLNWNGSLANEGRKPVEGTNKTYALRLDSFVNVKIENCTVTDMYGTAFNISGSDQTIVNAIIQNNTLINVGDCYGEGRSAGGTGIRLYKAQGIIANNYIHNNFLDGEISTDGNIHRRNWIGINCGENKAKSIIICNNDIYGYDRAIHLELVSNNYPQTIRNNYISGCDVGITIWNAGSCIDIQQNTFMNTDLDSEHSYIGSSVSNLRRKAIALIGPYNAKSTNISHNYVKCIKDFLPIGFVAMSSPYTNNSYTDEEGKYTTAYAKNINVSYNIYENLYTTIQVFILYSCSKFISNHINAPLCEMTFNEHYSDYNIRLIVANNYINVSSFIFSTDQFNIKFIPYNNTLIFNNVIENANIKNIGFSHGIFSKNIFRHCKLSFKTSRRNLILGEDGFPTIYFESNRFEDTINTTDYNFIQSDGKNKVIFYSDDKTYIKDTSNNLLDLNLFMVERIKGKSIINAKQEACLTGVPASSQEVYIGGIRGKFKVHDIVNIVKNNKKYRFTESGYFSKCNWFPNSYYAINELINEDGYIYQVGNSTIYGKSGEQVPNFPNKINATIKDNDIMWTCISNKKLEPYKEYKTSTVFNFGDLIYVNNYTYEANMYLDNTGQTKPIFNKELGSVTLDGVIKWTCRGKCINYEEVTPINEWITIE